MSAEWGPLRGPLGCIPGRVPSRGSPGWGALRGPLEGVLLGVAVWGSLEVGLLRGSPERSPLSWITFSGSLLFHCGVTLTLAGGP